ncbi:thioredoxin family protein [Nitratifractor sp.]
MRRISILFITLIMAASAEDLYSQGKRIFAERCSSCHGSYIDPATIKKNFFEMNNTLLHLKAPTVNMLVYAITKGSKKVGDPSDKEMRADEVAAYLQDYLTHPDRRESICDPTVMEYYATKKPIRGLDEKDYEALAHYFLRYNARRTAAAGSSEKPAVATANLHNVTDERRLLEQARKGGRILLIEAMSSYCHYCVAMDRSVFPDPEISRLLASHFLFDQIDIHRARLPFGLRKVYRHLTPSFFFLDSRGRLLAHYPGSWTRDDFLKILKEVIQKSKETPDDSRR